MKILLTFRELLNLEIEKWAVYTPSWQYRAICWLCQIRPTNEVIKEELEVLLEMLDCYIAIEESGKIGKINANIKSNQSVYEKGGST